MNEFPEIPVSSLSIARRKPVYGVGINDSEYMVSPFIGGKKITCPIYQKWKNMLLRCYCKKYQSRYPRYGDCSVADEWLTFSSFRGWMSRQEWEGKHLDKDILIKNNKVYSSDACVFVSSRVNAFFIVRDEAENGLPHGVSFDASRNKYKAEISDGPKVIHVGRFDRLDCANSAWRDAKSNLALNLAASQKDARVRDSLIRFSIEIKGP